ncbi:putative quercetindioxygenase [Acetobacter orientalis]|uniref:Putative quercetindioxygenase n=1 Tax=Acetobacter orientalis TaxID=146474 RepID=A0A2Z5ZH86_9PROT|nr:putative quercetindioxygenase [Acetobacter orientalis]
MLSAKFCRAGAGAWVTEGAGLYAKQIKCATHHRLRGVTPVF